jgi:hypothetical protein
LSRYRSGGSLRISELDLPGDSLRMSSVSQPVPSSRRSSTSTAVSSIAAWTGWPRHDSIDANDLNNLGRSQRHIREQGVECFVLVAVMRALREEETTALRDFAQRPRTLPARTAIEPVQPIILAEQNRSAPG